MKFFYLFFFFCNSSYSLYPEHWIIQEPVYVLHLITCHGRIMPRLAELLLQLCTIIIMSIGTDKSGQTMLIQIRCCRLPSVPILRLFFFLTWARLGLSIVITCHLSVSLPFIRPHHWMTSSKKKKKKKNNPGPIFFKLHVEPSVKRGLKICTNGHGLLVNIAAMPMYGENTWKFSPEAFRLNLGI